MQLKKLLAKKKIAIALTSSLTFLGVSSMCFAGVTLANYYAIDNIDQQASYSGLVKPSIFLNYNVWDVNNVDEVYYMYAFNSGNADYEYAWIESSVFLNGVSISGWVGSFKMYVFLFDHHLYDKFIFVRMNANGDIPTWGAKWNQTNDITYSASNNYYCINDFDGDNGNSAYNANHIYYNGSTLVAG